MNIFNIFIKKPKCPKCNSKKYVKYISKEIKKSKIEKSQSESIGNGINQFCKIVSQFEKLGGAGQAVYIPTKMLGLISKEIIAELGKTKLIKYFKCSKCKKEFKIIEYIEK